MTFKSRRNRISILKSGRRALESRSATTFATRWHREKGRIAAFEFFFFVAWNFVSSSTSRLVAEPKTILPEFDQGELFV